MLSIGRIKDISVQVTLNLDWTPGSGRTPLLVGTYEIATPDGGHPPEQTNFYTNVLFILVIYLMVAYLLLIMINIRKYMII